MQRADSNAGRRRRRGRSCPEEDPEFQIAPMIDILLVVLLVFFMSISSTEVLQSNHSISRRWRRMGSRPRRAARGR